VLHTVYGTCTGITFYRGSSTGPSWPKADKHHVAAMNTQTQAS